MKVSVSAIGSIRKYLPGPYEIELDEPVSLSELKELAGIPANVSASFTVNGQIRKGDYTVQDNDGVKFIMIVGAG